MSSVLKSYSLTNFFIFIFFKNPITVAVISANECKFPNIVEEKKEENMTSEKADS